MAKQQEKPKEEPLAFVIIPICLVILLMVFWALNRHGIYYGTGKMTYWMLWPFDMFSGVHEYRLSIIKDMGKLPDPELVVSWAGNAWRVPSALLGAIAVRAAYKAFRHPIKDMKGPLSVDALMRFQAQVHSPIAPIVPIAMSMHKNEDERFHESYHPHEVVEKFNLLNKDKTLNREAAEKYFLAQLGKRIYRPGLDDPNTTVFADRLNDYEKVIFALLAPLAINMKAGLPEYDKLNDAINYSAVNEYQVPDLRLANELYTKYRDHPKLNNLFRRHHFSVTYLMQLYLLAKRSGKVATSHWVGWLRPNASPLYVALNTSGRETPFTESAGAFAQWKFELACEKKKMMPILPCVVGAVAALESEWQFWQSADQRETEETLWGRMSEDQGRRDVDLFRRFVTDMLVPQSNVPAGEDTLFDQQVSSERRAYEDDQLAKMMSGVKQNLPTEDAEKTE